jgi:hypothetical protein
MPMRRVPKSKPMIVVGAPVTRGEGRGTRGENSD